MYLAGLHSALVPLRISLSGDLKRAALYLQRLGTLLEDNTLTGLDKNKDVWFFRAEHRPVKFYSIEGKKIYVFYSLCSTLYILNQKKDSESCAKKAGAIPADIITSIKRLVTSDLKRFAEKHKNYLPSVNKFVKDYL